VFLLGPKWSATGYIEEVRNLPALSGAALDGLPLEELVFALSFGLYGAAVHEDFAWLRVTDGTAQISVGARRMQIEEPLGVVGSHGRRLSG
jgi:hypothetical protein